jgi:hypothetical protein
MLTALGNKVEEETLLAVCILYCNSPSNIKSSLQSLLFRMCTEWK